MFRLETLESDGDRTLWLRRTWLWLLATTVGVGVGSVALEVVQAGTVYALPVALLAGVLLVLTWRLLQRAARYGAAEVDARRLFHEVVDHLPTGFTMKDPSTGVYVGWNRTAEQMTGIPRAQALGRTARDVLAPELADQVEAWDAEALEGDEVRVHESTLTKGRRTLSLLSRRVVVRDPRGRARYLFVLDDDVTPLRRRELEILARHRMVLRHQQALLDLGQRVAGSFEESLRDILLQASRALDVARVGFWTLEEEQTEVRCRLLVQDGEVVPTPDGPLQARAYPAYFAALAERRPVVAADAAAHPATAAFVSGYLEPLGIGAMLDVPVWNAGGVVGILCCEHVGGTRTWPQEQIDFAVALSGLISLAIETDRRRRAESALEERRRAEEVASYLNAMPVGVFVVDREGRPTFANDAAATLLGRGIRPDATGTGLAEVYQAVVAGTNEPYPSSRMPVLTALQGRTDHVEDMEVRQPNGRVVPLEVFGAPVLDASGEVSNAVAVFRDITERREIERVKDEIISVVSHELRTPMTSVIGALGLVDGGVLGPLPADAGEMVHVALTNARRLVNLLDRILDVEKVIKERLERRAVSMLEVVGRSVTLATPGAAGMGVTLHVRTGADTTVWGDPERLQQVLDNLISNAVKFSPQGGVVTVGLEPRSADRVRVWVRDDGPGIGSDDQPRLFKRFSQVDSSTTRQKGGTGLGLSICKDIVERHEGQVGVDSTLGEGSTFWFELPAADAKG